MHYIQLFSIVLEFAVCVVGILLGWRKLRPWGYTMAFTYLIYVYYDVAKLYGWELSANELAPLFLVATISAVVTVGLAYRQG